MQIVFVYHQCFLALFTLEVCVAARIREKFTRNPYFWSSRSFKVIVVGTFGKLVSSAYYKVCVLSICNRSHARRANSGKTSYRGHPSLMPSFEGNLLTHRHEICSLETRDSMLSYGKNPESLSHLLALRAVARNKTFELLMQCCAMSIWSTDGQKQGHSHKKMWGRQTVVKWNYKQRWEMEKTNNST